MTSPKKNPDLSEMAKDLQRALKTADEIIEKALPFAAVAQTAFAAVMDSVRKATEDAFVAPKDSSPTDAYPSDSAKTETPHFEERSSYDTARGWDAWAEDIARDLSIVVGDDAVLNALALKSSTGISPVIRVEFADTIRVLLREYGPVHLTIAARVIREAYNGMYIRRVESGVPKPRKDAKKINTPFYWREVTRWAVNELGTVWTQDEEDACVDKLVRGLIEQIVSD